MKKLFQNLLKHPTPQEQARYELEIAALDLLDAKSSAEEHRVKIALAEMAVAEARAELVCAEVVVTQRAARVARLMAELREGGAK